MSERILHLEVVINTTVKCWDNFKLLLPEIITEHLKYTSYRNQLVYFKKHGFSDVLH